MKQIAMLALFISGAATMTDPAYALEKATDTAVTPVTVDNFVRAESDTYIESMAKEGGLGKLYHRREPASIDKQTVIRLNRDTLYTSGVFDLDAGPVNITLPDPGKRFMSLQVVNQDHYTPNVFYGAGSHTLTRENVGTRYVFTAIRTLVDPNNPDDIKQVHALQDAISASQKSPGALELPHWEATSQKKVRDALLVLSSTITDFKKAFGTREEVDPVHHLLGTAAGWGGNPDKDATYLSFAPTNNDGKTNYRLTVRDVPVDGFWSVSVYNAQGYFEKNAANAYTLNNLTGKKSNDGSITVQFGGCDSNPTNCLPIMKGWNYTVRLYRPRPEILANTWKFPDPQPIK